MRKGWLIPGVLAIVLVILVSLGGYFVYGKRHVSRTQGFPKKVPVNRSQGDAASHFDTNQMDVNRLSSKEIAAEIQRRNSVDSKWEWKTPISFYGRVLDQSGHPIPGAQVHFQWTDLSLGGTSVSDTVADETGAFSLTNATGKRLIVRVSKSGYSPSTDPSRSFDFANPYEEIYYLPRPNKPVTFTLIKKTGAELYKGSAEIMLPEPGRLRVLELQNGASFSTRVEVTAWKPWPPQPGVPHYDWKITLAITGGGLVESQNAVGPAPEKGYESRYSVDMQAASKDWSVSTSKTLFFVTPQPMRYGRLTFRTKGDSRYVFIDYVVNLSGGRELD